MITVDEIPNDGNLEAKKFKFLHNNMGDFYVLHCRDMNSGNEYDIIVKEGYAFKYLEGLRSRNNPFRFSIKRVLDEESGQYTISINEEHNWIMLH